jgi:DNA-binding transcriptional regulator YhcF (GntR family)
MKKSSITAGIIALVLFVGILMSVSNVVWAQGLRDAHHGKGFWADLTEEQREAVQEKKEEMRSQGATREEIHSAVAEMLKGYGIEVPEDCHGPKGFSHRKAGFKANLTDEQREAIREKKEEMRSQGATREEIHAAVAEMFKGYGIDLPEDWKGLRARGGFGPGPGGFWADLTDEQREAIHDKIKEMRDQDATREEIHAAVVEILKGYGIDVPEDWGEGRKGDQRQRCRLTQDQRESVRNLADEQRRTVRETIREMRRQGATCEEIQEKVDQMLEGIGIQSPGDSQNPSSENASATANIQAQSYPNPFNPETEIAYTLSSPEIVQMQIYNIGGQVVRTFEMGYQTAGSYSVRWDGCNENGEPAASGIYFFRIDAGQDNVTNRMVLLK